MVHTPIARYLIGMHRFLWCAVFLAACSSSSSTTTPSSAPATEPSGGETNGEAPVEEPAAPVAFTDAEVQELFDTRCVRCHAGATTVLDLRDFKKTTIGVPAATSSSAECSDSATPTRIVPGDRNASLLWHKVKGTQDCGDPMPPPLKGTKLTAAQLESLGLYIDGLATD
jgi:hypothetical protein